ncbi:hypothetical protein ACH4SP_00560 [Streptomyces sp. NPDC021093]|uniref:hypothetical protein n=1 Tax=Streptomyces sp. NPDC021093 TaxID=3365112 RepID=UPI003794256E
MATATDRRPHLALSPEAYASWVPDDAVRRLAAYKLLAAYGSNQAGEPAALTGNETTSEGREFGVPAAFVDTALAHLLSQSQQIIVLGAGALTFTRTTSYEHNVTVTGYSKPAVNPQRKAIRCDVRTKHLTQRRQMTMECDGFTPGVSGSPWIQNYDPVARTGRVIGNLGGNGGGGSSDWQPYAPIYGQDAQDLYNDAVAGRKVIRTSPYQPPADKGVLPGNGELWTHAHHLISGDFSQTGHSDLIVVWSDGEVTLFPGDGQGDFRPERQGSIWGASVQITAGRFNATTFVTDLIVRGKDGELSLYTNTSSGTLGQEHMLRAASPEWEQARLLTSGEFSGQSTWELMVCWDSGQVDHGLTDDVLVRWKDGETSLYVDSATTRIGTEHTLVSPH